MPACFRVVIPRRVVHAVILVSFMLLGGCGGGGDPATPETVPTISLSKTTLTLQGVGAEEVLGATVTPAGSAVTWTSSRPDVATVSGSGTSIRVVAVAAGTASITAQVTAGSRHADAQASVQVVPIVRSVRIDSIATTMIVGGTTQLRTRVVADAGADTSVRWTSSAPAIATVSATGLVTAVSAGTVRIDAISNTTSSATANVQLTIVSPVVRGLAIAPATDTIPLGGSRRLTATVDADAGLATTVTWSSSTPAVATVAADGLVTAVAIGTTQITARSVADTSRRAQAAIVVRAPIVRSISIAALAGVRERDERTMQATVDAETGADARVTWSSSDPTVATVTADGVLSALRAGTTTITVQSIATATTRGTRAVTVSAASPFVSWTRQPMGIVGTLRIEGSPLSLVSRSATQSMVTMLGYDWPFPYDSATYATTGADWSKVAGNNFSIPAIYGLATHANGEVIGFGGSFVADRRLYRWNGSWQLMPMPNVGIFDGIIGPQSLPGGSITTKARDGSFDLMVLWNGVAWVEVRRVARPTNYQQGLSWMLSSTVGFMHQNFAGNYNLFQHSSPSVLTPVPQPSTGAIFTATYRGTGVDSLWVLGSSANRLHRWTGTDWIVYENGWPAGGFGQTLELCNGIPVVMMSDGRVYRWNVDRFAQLGTDSEILHGEGEARERQMSCAPDGTLRVTGGSGSIARWSGTTWVLETFTPRFSSVSVASTTVAWAGSTVGRIYRWNGTNWDESYRPATSAIVGAIRSITSWPDGRAVALRGSTTILRRNNGAWTAETGAELTGVNAVWGPNADLVFAVRTDGRIIRSVNGGAWQAITPAGTALRAIEGQGNYAIAIGASLRTMRWDGSTWTEVLASVPATFNADRLHVSATNDAWVAASAVSNQSATRILRFDGTTWNQVDVSNIGGNDAALGTTTLAMFGAGPSNVYAVRGSARGPRVLYRFDQQNWSMVTQLSNGVPDWVHLGSAVPGFALIAGSRGEVLVSRPAEPYRVGR